MTAPDPSPEGPVREPIARWLGGRVGPLAHGPLPPAGVAREALRPAALLATLVVDIRACQYLAGDSLPTAEALVEHGLGGLDVAEAILADIHAHGLARRMPDGALQVIAGDPVEEARGRVAVAAAAWLTSEDGGDLPAAPWCAYTHQVTPAVFHHLQVSAGVPASREAAARLPLARDLPATLRGFVAVGPLWPVSLIAPARRLPSQHSLASTAGLSQAEVEELLADLELAGVIGVSRGHYDLLTDTQQ